MKKVQAILKRISWKNLKIRGQMYWIYVLALFLPLGLIGTGLVVQAYNMMNEYYEELLVADNKRIREVFSQITTQLYSITDDICFDETQKSILSQEYQDSSDFIKRVNIESNIDGLVYNNMQVKGIQIYCTNPTITSHKQYHTIEGVEDEEWYKRAMEQTGAFWTSVSEINAYGTVENSIAIVRRILLKNSDYKAVVVVKIADSYVRTRLSTNEIDAIALDDLGVVYSSKNSWYGRQLPIKIDYNDMYFSYTGIVEDEGTEYFTAVSTTNLYMTNSKMYISTMNGELYYKVRQILNMMVFILIIAIFIPGIVLILFTHKFTERVYLLREEMHKASMKDYDMREKFSGHDELTDAFEDLKKMVDDIKETQAKMYEAELKEKELINNQQIMEYKMLASQINPHYLYNTLETIRMKALTMGNKEVADCIKILGKTLQYVLKNTGTTSTTLKKEIEHVENYLMIQKMRFGDRINYTFNIEEGFNSDEYQVLPLILQPIVENAVIHGLENVDDKGMIYIEICENDREQLQITVTDNGRGMEPETFNEVQKKLSTPGLKLESSIGVYNICERIRLHYGNEYGVELESRYGEGTKVILRMPVINVM